MLKQLSFLFLGIYFLNWIFNPKPLVHMPGVLVEESPLQESVPGGQGDFSHKEYLLTPLAKYSIKARLLLKNRHRFFDAVADISPFDFAVGWGKMSDQSVLDRLDLSQSGRFYYWRYQGQPPIPEADITSHSGNIHLIPKNKDIFDRIDDLREGALFKASGLLVEANKLHMNPWRSSLSRTDSGDGACELMWVEKLEAL